MSHLTIVFSHGKETGPRGTKINALSAIAHAHGHAVVSIDYRDLASPEDRVARLMEQARQIATPLVLAGSSMGGYVSVVASRTLRPVGLFLMAPALALDGYAERMPLPSADAISVIGGWRDDLIDPLHLFEFARRSKADLLMTDADHRLDPALSDVERQFRRLLERIEGM